MHARTNAHAHTHTCTPHTHTHAHTHARTHTHKNTHARTHAHMHAPLIAVDFCKQCPNTRFILIGMHFLSIRTAEASGISHSSGMRLWLHECLSLAGYSGEAEPVTSGAGGPRTCPPPLLHSPPPDPPALPETAARPVACFG